MKKEMNAKAMLSISMAIFGTLGIFTRNIAVSSGELALYRAVLAAMLIAVYLVGTKQKINFKAIKKELFLLLLSGIAMGINWILLFQAYKYTTISLATLSYYFAPVIVTAVCPVLFHEKLTRKQIVCFIMSTVGLIMITGIGDIGGGSDYIGILFGLGAAVFYATVILLNKFIKNVEGIHRTFLPIPFRYCYTDPLCYNDKWSNIKKFRRNRMGKSFDCRACSYGHYILYVFFFFEGIAGTKSGYPQLY